MTQRLIISFIQLKGILFFPIYEFQCEKLYNTSIRLLQGIQDPPVWKKVDEMREKSRKTISVLKNINGPIRRIFYEPAYTGGISGRTKNGQRHPSGYFEK